MDDGMMDNGDDGHMGGGHDESSDVAADARRIEVTATSFKFDPAEIRVEAGEDVAIVLSSDDLLHDFTIDELDAHVAADRGETEEGGFAADEPGRYTYCCTVAGQPRGRHGRHARRRVTTGRPMLTSLVASIPSPPARTRRRGATRADQPPDGGASGDLTVDESEPDAAQRSSSPAV